MNKHHPKASLFRLGCKHSLQRRAGFIFLCFMLTLVGCGFHLRGTMHTPPQLHTLYLRSQDPYGQLTKQLQHTLQSSGIQLARSASQAPFTLDILAENFKQQTTSISATTRLIQYILSYSVTYQICNSHGKVVSGPFTINTNRNYAADFNQMLGASNEQALLQQDMRHDVIYQLLNQLGSANTQGALLSAK